MTRRASPNSSIAKRLDSVTVKTEYIIYYIMKIYKCHTNKFVRKLEQISVPGVELASNCADLFTREYDI